jgi:hypothetical protein
MIEMSVSCDWCDAEVGEYCKDPEGKRYPEDVHRIRRMRYDFYQKKSLVKGRSFEE